MITVAIIGAGPLGRRLALQSAQVGFRVALEDVMPASLRHAEETLREALGPSAMPQVRFATTVEDAVRDADLAIDCVPDELESKLEIFSLLDRMAPPRTIFLTPTTLSIADLARCTYRPDRCIAIGMSSSQLAAVDADSSGIPLRITGQTSPEAKALVCEFWQRLGYVPAVELDNALEV